MNHEQAGVHWFQIYALPFKFSMIYYVEFHNMSYFPLYSHTQNMMVKYSNFMFGRASLPQSEELLTYFRLEIQNLELFQDMTMNSSSCRMENLDQESEMNVSQEV